MAVSTSFGSRYVPGSTDTNLEEAVRILNQQINQAMQSEAGKDYLLKRGLLGFPGTPQDLQALQARDTDRWGRAIKAAGMEPQ